MQFKVTLISLFAALAVASPLLEKRCTANGGVCNFNNAECCSGNCQYSIGDSNAYCAATSKRDAAPEPEPLLEKRCSANGIQCNFNNAECCSDICLYNWDDGKAYCSAPLREKRNGQAGWKYNWGDGKSYFSTPSQEKREAEAVPEPVLEKRCTANGGQCNFQNSECCSGNCLIKLGEGSDGKAYCSAPSKEKREAEVEPVLEKRCTANGGACNFQNSECCSGNCLYKLGDSTAYCAA